MIKMTRKRRTKRRPGKCPQILKGNHYEAPRDELETNKSRSHSEAGFYSTQEEKARVEEVRLSQGLCKSRTNRAEVL